MRLLPVTIAITGALAAQVPLGQVCRAKPSDRILNAELRSKINKILEEHIVPGYSVGIFRLGATEEEEYGHWGERTEAGDPMTEDVSTRRPLVGH
jgi:hypothetical protein